MRYKIRKLLSKGIGAILAVEMILMSVPGFGIPAFGEDIASMEQDEVEEPVILGDPPVTSGKIEGAVSWEYNDVSTTLKVYKEDGQSGAIPEYSYGSNYPWQPLAGSITKVVIDEGITSIGGTSYSGGAFGGYNNLAEVSLPSTLTSIGRNAFVNCGSLTKLTHGIPEGVLTIGQDAFLRSKLKSVVIPDSVTSLGWAVFGESPALQSVTIGTGLKKIEYRLFINCSSLTEINIPANVTEIAEEAFKGCSALKKTTLNEGLNKIGKSAFYGCSSLKSIEIPDSVDTLEYAAFAYCSSLESLKIGNGLDGIEEAAYFGCTSLEDIEFGNSVKKIGKEAFKECSGLKKLTIPETITNIGESSFYECTGLSELTLPDTLTTVGNFAFAKCTDLQSVTIPKGMIQIPQSMFEGCSTLKSVTLSENTALRSIGNSAFYNCESLKKVVFPENLETIGNYAFQNSDLTGGVVFGNSLTSIGEAAFAGTRLDNVRFPSSLDTAGIKAFNTKTIKRVYFPISMKYISEDAFVNCQELKDVYYESGEADWNKVNIFNNTNIDTAKKHFNYKFPTGISLDSDEYRVKEGKTLSLNEVLTVSPSGADKTEVDWFTSDREKASIDEIGTVKGLLPGETTITVSTRELFTDMPQYSDSCKVIIEEDENAPTEIKLDEHEIFLDIDESKQLLYKILPEAADQKEVTWESSNETVAKVDENGNVTGVNYGEADITVTTNLRKKSDKCHVTVTYEQRAVPPIGIKLNTNTLELRPQEEAYLTATVLPYNADQNKVKWESDNPAVAKVSSTGRVTALSPGTAVIKVKTDNEDEDYVFEDSCSVTVRKPVYGEDPSSYSTVIAGGKLDITVLFVNITGITRYFISNKSVAKVNKKGIVTAKKTGGKVVVEAQTKEAGGWKTVSSSEITVQVPVMEKSRQINSAATELNASDLLTGVDYLPTEWISTKPDVVSVDKDGKLTFKKKGTAKIIAVFGSGKNSTKKKYKTKLKVRF